MWAYVFWIFAPLAALGFAALGVYVITRAFYAAKTGSWRQSVRNVLSDIKRAKENE